MLTNKKLQDIMSKIFSASQDDKISKYKAMFAFTFFIHFMGVMLFMGVWAPVKLLFLTAVVTKIAAMPLFELFTKGDNSIFTYEKFTEACSKGKFAEVYINPAVKRLGEECKEFQQELKVMKQKLGEIKENIAAFKGKTVASMETVATSASELAANMSKTLHKTAEFGSQVKEKAVNVKTMFTELVSAIKGAASFGTTPK